MFDGALLLCRTSLVAASTATCPSPQSPALHPPTSTHSLQPMKWPPSLPQVPHLRACSRLQPLQLPLLPLPPAVRQHRMLMSSLPPLGLLVRHKPQAHAAERALKDVCLT